MVGDDQSIVAKNRRCESKGIVHVTYRDWIKQEGYWRKEGLPATGTQSRQDACQVSQVSEVSSSWRFVRNLWTLMEPESSPSQISQYRILADALIVFIVAIFCYSWMLGVSPLASTEGHRVIAAHQMVQSGDWLLPQLYGRLYLRKPPLHYWILAASEKLSGLANEWVWRLPSAMASAALAAILCLLSARWFSRRAGIVAGFAYVGLIPLWYQSRTAEIDSVNTLLSVTAACCLIEISFGAAGRTRMWVLIASLTIGAALLAKGHTGLPLIFGALLGPAITLRTLHGLKHPGVWVSLAIGAFLFAGWVLAVHLVLQRRHLPLDTSGLSEALEAFSLHQPGRMFQALLVPLTLFVYASPASFALLLALRPPHNFGEGQRRILKALVGTILISILIFLLAGTTNPRYEYLVLPLLCPCVGAVTLAWDQGLSSFAPQRLHQLVGVMGGILGIAHLALVTILWPLTQSRMWLVVSAVLTAVILVYVFWNWFLSHLHPSAWSLVAMITLLAVPYAEWHNQDRFKRSAYIEAQKLRTWVGPAVSVLSDKLLMDKPELFFYAEVGVEPISLKEPQRLTPGRWIALDRSEWLIWQAELPKQLPEYLLLRIYRSEAHVFRLPNMSLRDSQLTTPQRTDGNSDRLNRP